MRDVDEIHQMLAPAPAAEPVFLERPEHLLLVIVRLDMPAESVQTQRIEHHIFGSCLTESSRFLLGAAHVQPFRRDRAEKQAALDLLRLRDIRIDEIVAEQVRQDTLASDEIVAHVVAAVEIVRCDPGSALSRVSTLPRWLRTASVHGGIDADVRDDGKILVTADTAQELLLGISAVKGQDDLAAGEFRHDIVDKIGSDFQLVRFVLPPHHISCGR